MNYSLSMKRGHSFVQIHFTYHWQFVTVSNLYNQPSLKIKEI